MDTLFIRKKTHFVPTKKAEQIYPKICEIIVSIENLSITIDTTGSGRECVIAVPATLSVGLPDYLNRLIKKECINIHLNIITSNREICKKILNGEVCIAITNRPCTKTKDCSPIDASKLHVESISVGEHVYVISDRHNTMWQSDLSLENIAKYPFVVIQLHGFNDKLDPFESYCNRHSIELDILLRTQNLASMIDALMLEKAVSFIGPHSAAKFISNVPSLRVEKLPDYLYQQLHEEMSKPTYSMIYLKDKESSIHKIITDGICSFISTAVC
jgi:DNA-binding transcriptional LysR family regulator